MANSLDLLRVIGLTGNVGMGKTTVSNYLAKAYQLPILDADLYARQAVEPGQLLPQIVARYGADILGDDGRLNRQRLGEILFGDAAERAWIEQLIHPAVRCQIEADLQALVAEKQPTAVVVVPLLFEANMRDLVSEIWVVQSSAALQLERLRQRDPQLSLAQIQTRISSQMPIEQKIAQADWVLDNSGSQRDLFSQIDQALQWVNNSPS